ncbi:MAG: hypothetical protein L0Y73_08465 [Candidatus Aminicenantes bacterium]|nr:hypothetical protein [Candidatus Aminicenantes bacterium]
MIRKNFILIIPVVLLITNCGRTAVRRVDTNAEQFKNLTQVTFSKSVDLEPAVSPDGEKILFVSKIDGDYNIYLKKDIFSRATIKKTFHSANDINPCFSPDGSKFAFSSNRSGNYDIFVMNVDQGSAKIQLTESENDDCFPNWSPDGGKIAFSQFSLLDKKWYIWIKNIKTGELVQVSEGLMPKFLPPDGKRILYKKSSKNYFGLWVMDIDGENDTQIIQGENWGVGTFCFHPNGGKILFSVIVGSFGKKFQYGYSKYTDLWLVDIDGSNFTQLTKHKGDDFDPCWGSNGDIYFSSNRNGYIDIWKFTPH